MLLEGLTRDYSFDFHEFSVEGDLLTHLFLRFLKGGMVPEIEFIAAWGFSLSLKVRCPFVWISCLADQIVESLASGLLVKKFLLEILCLPKLYICVLLSFILALCQAIFGVLFFSLFVLLEG